MADAPPTVAAALGPPQQDYLALFVTYVVRSAEALWERLADAHAQTAADFVHKCDHALHVLTFALATDAAWPAARELLLVLAEPMEQAGERSVWLPFLSRGVERSRALADCPAEAELSLRSGHLLRLTSDFDAAQHLLAASLRCFEQLHDPVGMARALNQLAYVDCLQQRTDAAQARALAALELLADDDFERAMSYFVLGMVAADRWCWVEAEAHHRATLALRIRQGDRRRIAWAQQNVGYALQGQGRFDEAIACLVAAGTTLEELGDKANRAIVQLNLARTHHLAGQFAQAVAINLAARSALYAAGDRLHAARLATNLGLDYLALDDPRAAQAAFEESATLYRALGNAAGRINANSGIALALLARGEHAAAAALLAPALAELETLENVPGKTTLQRTMTQNLTRARAALGDPSGSDVQFDAEPGSAK